MKKAKKKNAKNKIILFLAILLILFVIYNLFFNKKISDNSNNNEYAIVITNQSENSNSSDISYNVINNEGKTYKKTSYTYSKYLQTKIEDNNLYVTINKSAKDIILFDNMNANTDTQYKVTEITKNIKDTFVGHFNTTTDYPVLFILFDDNTAQYIDIETSFYSGKFSISGSIDISNIDYFSNVDITTKDNLSYIGVIATDLNGKNYEITSDMINR